MNIHCKVGYRPKFIYIATFLHTQMRAFNCSRNKIKNLFTEKIVVIFLKKYIEKFNTSMILNRLTALLIIPIKIIG